MAEPISINVETTESQPVVNAIPYSVNVDFTNDTFYITPSQDGADGADGADDPPNPSPNPSRSTAPSHSDLALAHFLSSDPDLAIFRRFDHLAAHALLTQQRDLHDLEAELDALAATDPDPRCGGTLRARAAAGDEYAVQRLVLDARLRDAVREYQDALLKQAQVLQLAAPRPSARRSLEMWIGHTFLSSRAGGHGQEKVGMDNGGDNGGEAAAWEGYFPRLVRDGRPVRDTPLARYTADDLVALRTPPDQDRLTVLLEDKFSHLLKPRRRRGEGRAEEEGEGGAKGVFYYPESRLRTLVSLVSLLVSFFLLIGAIVVLYFVKNKGVKLGLLAVFTFVFAVAVGLLTNASRSEVFGSTAAYAAVLVVFLGGSFFDEGSS